MDGVWAGLGSSVLVPLWHASKTMAVLSVGVMLAVLFGRGTHVESGGPRGATASEEFRAQRFVVVDQFGSERAEFGVLPGGDTRLVIRNNQKKTVTWVSVDADGVASLGIVGPEGEPLAELAGADKKLPVFILRDGKGKRRVGLTVSANGTAGVAFYDQVGENRCTISSGRDGHPALSLSDDRGKTRLSLVVEKDGTAAIDLADGSERTRISLHVDQKGMASLVLFGAGGEPLWSQQANR